jgi:hypothetical protein
MYRILFMLVTIFALLSAPLPAFAEGEDQGSDQGDLSQKLNNPVAALITVPIEYNRDTDIGPGETGENTSLKFSPVVPFGVHEDWNVISRTIVSYVHQELPEAGINEDGLSDIAQTFFFSPKVLGDSGIIWGAGPLFLFDSATESSLGAGRWGMGPSFVVLKQTKTWTVGGLAFYLADIGGDGDRSDVEQIFIQPFISYALDNKKTSFTLQAEITEDLENKQTGAFLLFQANQLFTLGSQILQGRIGVRQWVERQGFGPQGTELNIRLTFLFPK